MTGAASAFKMIPGQTELHGISRDLRFHPSPVQQPQTLTAAQVAAFNRDGFLRGIRIFSPEEMATHRAYFEGLLARVLAAGGDSYSISTAHLKYGPVYDLLTHPRIVGCVKDILGENVIGWGSHYFCKMPGDGKRVAWHQDASYWPLTPSKAVTVWLAIDDADVANGCMKVIPGTHYYGHLTYEMTENNAQDVLDQVIPDIERFGPPVNIELQAGEISLHTDLLLHGSEPNTSSRRRCGLTLRYCTPDVRAYLDWHLKGVLVSGSDPTGHWANPGRPQGE
jgi:ectoine hydroxylase-related dioxygenase (phytanoyl-CoA dioxygenase family)